ncbi:2359_t:CDS:2 [Funneliformis mosseae]|uniref:2359_t:CDS:1 n=1 Tax=Funneliformis mosseae TaxID=27381 RepID=A0A9N9G2S5_FUNMO|nr:2359_t:CDS:2 [Funneliformis mosseae]
MNYTIMCLKNDGLDSSHYVSASGMFNDSFYKSSKTELKLMTNMDKYLTIENDIREGIIMTSHRYAKVNNLQHSDYESSKLNFWIIFKDMNTLYLASDAKIDYTLEVNLEVLVYLYDYFADYPLAPEKQIVSEE